MQKREGPIKIGVTGGIGAGKSLVCEILINFKIPVYNADKQAKILMENDPEVLSRIKETFTENAYLNGRLNSEYLSNEIFNNDEQLAKMNGIVHPAVNRDFENWVLGHHGHRLVVKEAALLFESGSYRDLDQVIVVYCPLETRIKRVLLRDQNRSRKEIENIIEKQLSDTEKKKLADFIITNDDTTPVLPQVLSVLEQLNIQ